MAKPVPSKKASDAATGGSMAKPVPSKKAGDAATGGSMAKPVPSKKAGDAATAVVPVSNPFEFRVYGPRKLSFTSWKDLLSSSWSVFQYSVCIR